MNEPIVEQTTPPESQPGSFDAADQASSVENQAGEPTDPEGQSQDRAAGDESPAQGEGGVETNKAGRDQIIADLAESAGMDVSDVVPEFMEQLNTLDEDALASLLNDTREKGKEKAGLIILELAEAPAEEEGLTKQPLNEQVLTTTLNVTELYNLAAALNHAGSSGSEDGEDQSEEVESQPPDLKAVFRDEVATMINDEMAEISGASLDSDALDRIIKSQKEGNPELSDEVAAILALRTLREANRLLKATEAMRDDDEDGGDNSAPTTEDEQKKRLDTLKERMKAALTLSGGVLTEFVSWNVDNSDLGSLIDAFFSEGYRAWGKGGNPANWEIEEGLKTIDKERFIEEVRNKPQEMAVAISKAYTEGSSTLERAGFRLDPGLVQELRTSTGDNLELVLRQAFDLAYVQMFSEGTEEDRAKKQQAWQRLVPAAMHPNEKPVYDSSVMSYWSEQSRIDKERWQDFGWSNSPRASQQPA